MLAKIKLMLELSDTTFDNEILNYIEQAIVDLQDVGIQVDVTRDANGKVTGTRTALEMAIGTYCQMQFSLAHGYPGNYDKIADAYNLQKDKLKKQVKYRA